jgi:hypothetical protein
MRNPKSFWYDKDELAIFAAVLLASVCPTFLLYAWPEQQ